MFELRRIGIVKRLSAQLLDLILLAVLSTGFIFILSLICNYSAAEELAAKQYEAWEDFQEKHVANVADFYGFTYEKDGEVYTIKNKETGEASSLDELIKKLSESKGEDGIKEAYPDAYAAYENLPSAAVVNAQYNYVQSLLFMIISLGILLSYIVLEFILPIILKNGQTVGKKVFGICLVRSDCVKITNLSLFVRTFLGKYIIETMIPIVLVFLLFFGGMGILAVVLFAVLEIVNVILFFVLKNRTPIHDLVAGTVAADMKLQMIFESEEELAEKKALKQKEFIEQSKS